MVGCTYLGLKPQALCLRPLAGLKNGHFHQIADSGVFSSVEQALPKFHVRSLKIRRGISALICMEGLRPQSAHPSLTCRPNTVGTALIRMEGLRHEPDDQQAPPGHHAVGTALICIEGLRPLYQYAALSGLEMTLGLPTWR